MKRDRNRIYLIFICALVWAGCNSEALERQAEQIRQQEAEITRQRKELEALAAGTTGPGSKAARLHARLSRIF